MRTKPAYILIGILLLSVVALEWRRGTAVEGFQTLPADIKCQLTTQFGRRIWLCDDGNQAKKLLGGSLTPIREGIRPIYVQSTDQVCTKRDTTTRPPIYGCIDWTRGKGEREVRTDAITSHGEVCDALVSAYWDFTGNLASVDETAKTLQSALDQHILAGNRLERLSTNGSTAVRNLAATTRAALVSKRGPIETQTTRLTNELRGSQNPRNILAQAVNQFRCKL